jgi:hypothetical protein
LEPSVAIPLASLIFGGVALYWTVRTGLNKAERDELDRLRVTDTEKNTTIRELRDENVYLMRRLAQMPDTPPRQPA